jgi:ferredoxin
VAVCPFDAIRLVDGRSAIDVEACMGCGVCVDKCEQRALALVRDASKGEPLEIAALLNAAALATEPPTIDREYPPSLTET